MAFINSVTDALGTVIGWVGTVVTELTKAPVDGEGGGALYALLPLLAVGVAVSALMLGVKAIKSFIWGA